MKTRTSHILRDRGSFRDPDGYIFQKGGETFRSIVNPNSPILQTKYQAFFQAAVEEQLLLDYRKVPKTDADPADAIALIKPISLPIVTYPYEWSFSQLKDAALVTLELNLLALSHGLTLKDATAFNVQLYGNRMTFIDHLSFEPSDGRMPWRPYSQFCRHFLSPLVISSYLDIHINRLFRVYIDGIPEQVTVALLPLRSFLNPTIFLHIFLHTFFIKKSFRAGTSTPIKQTGAHQADLLSQLKAATSSLEPAKQTSTWSNYYENTNYNELAFREKINVVANIFSNERFSVVWDIGANDGTFSRVVAPFSDLVLSLDLDHNATDGNYIENRRLGHTSVYPLVFDITNPSPGIGFANSERSSLNWRSSPDAILLLALLHHLCISHNLPFSHLAEYFHSFDCAVVVEFVDREDSQVRRLCDSKGELADWYTREEFERCFAQRFRITSRVDLSDSCRSIYLLHPIQN
jgi:hypothetical protein